MACRRREGPGRGVPFASHLNGARPPCNLSTSGEVVVNDPPDDDPTKPVLGDGAIDDGLVVKPSFVMGEESVEITCQDPTRKVVLEIYTITGQLVKRFNDSEVFPADGGCRFLYDPAGYRHGFQACCDCAGGPGIWRKPDLHFCPAGRRDLHQGR